MLILHCIKEKLYEEMREDRYFGKVLLKNNPFIHCSSIEYFWRVSPHFDNEKEKLVLLVIDTDNLDVPVKWEDLEGCGREYPHIYGLVKMEAIKNVLPYLKKEDGTWIKNEELKHIADK
ncbi:hypothetical protein HMPREF9477_01050 [Lachnospiraceae bacterium 2_1_46FAA]|nr:hypothetical protein HMPREF9477_01050 [Lachnospiraceae bacterium 2_1_46FAA]